MNANVEDACVQFFDTMWRCKRRLKRHFNILNKQQLKNSKQEQ